MGTLRRDPRSSFLWLTGCLRYLLLCLLSISLTACSLHRRVTLVAPSASAQPEQRFEAFEKLRPVGVLRYRNSQMNTTLTQLELGDQTLVTDPRDLLAVVPPESATARSVRRYTKHRRMGYLWTWVGRGLVLGTLAILIGGRSWEKQGLRTWGAVATGTGALSSFALQIREMVLEDRELHVVYHLYERDLMRHLGLRLQYNGPRVRQRRSSGNKGVVASSGVGQPKSWIEVAASQAPRLGVTQ